MRRIKTEFNREFDEVLRLKAAEIARIAEKNVRIAKIISQLKLEESLTQPELGSGEEPEQLLTVEVERHGEPSSCDPNALLFFATCTSILYPYLPPHFSPSSLPPSLPPSLPRIRR